MTLIEALQTNPGLFVGAVFVLGLIIGSFLNVVIHRLPIMMNREWRKQCAELAAEDAERTGKASTATPVSAEDPRFNLLVPRSCCPACKAPIRAWQNIPLLSYLILRGKCAACGARISLRYPIVELLTGVLSAAVAWRYGVGIETLAALLATWSLIALAGIDIDHKYLPDSITLPLLWLGLLASVVLAAEPHRAFPVDMRSSIIGAVVGYLSLWTVYHLFKLLTGKEGMGYGDFKLFAAFGALFGAGMLLPIIILAAGTGAIVGIVLIAMRRQGRDTQIPFGPYLASAGWIALMWGPEIANRLMPGLRGV
jgi:leader peptidase (prepilin peptidase)/N-methyltransferase